MTDTNTAPAGGADAIVSVPVSTPASTDNTPITASEAARQLANWRYKQANPEPDKPDAAPEAAAAETPAEEPPQGDDAQPETADPVETTKEPDPVVEEQPSVEAPRSWAKDGKDAFKLLPPGLQKDIAELERSREVEIRRGQNEVAEKLKGLTLREQQAEQRRQQYESALPQLSEAIRAAQSGEFADIKTQDDVDKLANEDWPRFARWQAHSMKVAAVEREAREAQDRQAQEFRSRWSQFATEQDQKLLDKAPELGDKTKQTQIADKAVGVLRDIGFTDQELAKAWNGEESVSLRDHRIQLLILDAMKYRDAKSAKPAPKPVPPVQRPGVAKAATTSADAEIQTLEKRFERTGNWKDGAALLNARRKAGA